MKLRYEGAFEANKSPEEIFKFLTDPYKFARTFPGFRNVKVSEEGSFTVNLTVNIGPLRGDATVEGRFTEISEYSYAKVSGRGVGVGSSLNFILEFRVASLNSTSKVYWIFEGKIGGLAASIGERVLNAIAKSLIDDIINNIVKALANTSTEPS